MPFYLKELVQFDKNTKQTEITRSPLFIIGHWRTGSTFLQQLLSLDEQFITPTLFQAVFPESFLVSERFYRPINYSEFK